MGRVSLHGTTQILVTALLALACLAACGSQSPPADPSKAAGVPVTREGYASTSFVVPFDMTPPGWLNPKPHIEQPNFVTWESPNLPAVRFLVPVVVYRPGESNPTPTPTDYLSYLLGQRDHGARFTDQATAIVGGKTATTLTATSDRALDGSLGCPAPNSAAADCFGLQPDLKLRIAVVPVRGTNLLIWLRLPKDASPSDTAARTAAFATMLATLRFSDRRASAPTPGPTASAQPGTSTLDGNYRMVISWPKTHTPAARCVGGAEGNAAESVYELSLDHGALQLWVRVGGPKAALEPADHSSFRVVGNQFIFHDEATTTTFTYDGRSLTLSDLKGGECGDRAIWTTKPWLRQ